MHEPWAFGRCGPALEANGFEPIPISRPHPSDASLGKRPPSALDAWSTPVPVATRLPRYARCGTGILAATTPAVDIDVRDTELAEALDRMVVSAAGDAPVRFGQAPKRLRAYRTDDPFPKLATSGYRLPGDEPDAKAHKVEILASGQQFVAYGVHPATSLPYAWTEDDPLNLTTDDLPLLTAGLAARIVAAAEAILAKAGASSCVGIGRPSPGRPSAMSQPGLAPRPVRDLGEARRVLGVLRGIDPSRLDYDTWVRVGYGVKAALGEHGLGVWLAWTRASARHDGTAGPRGTPERAWRGIRPQRCGWRYLERLAAGLGHG